jgi:hypothetical protein
MYVYSRLGDPANAGLPEHADAGWLVGASARGLPYRRAWIDHAGRPDSAGPNIWWEMAFAAPAPTPRQAWPCNDEDAYILQQDASGAWWVDPWANGSGTIRAAQSAMTAPAASGGRDLGNTCFIIELAYATQPVELIYQIN